MKATMDVSVLQAKKQLQNRNLILATYFISDNKTTEYSVSYSWIGLPNKIRIPARSLTQYCNKVGIFINYTQNYRKRPVSCLQENMT